MRQASVKPGRLRSLMSIPTVSIAPGARETSARQGGSRTCGIRQTAYALIAERLITELMLPGKVSRHIYALLGKPLPFAMPVPIGLSSR